MELNQEFLIETFFSYCKRPLHKKYQNVYNAECPVCKEGKSSGRSRRLFYFPHKQYLYCHNCAKSWKPFEWVREVTALTVPEIIKKNKERAEGVIKTAVHIETKPVLKEIPDLPEDSIDLTNEFQLQFYKDNKIIELALNYCKERLLTQAINSCKKFYVSLVDRVHKNRLIIPFFNKEGRIVCYQTRSLLKEQSPKYLTKFGEKDLFGINNITEEVPFIFIFEGPIDSMFVKNGVAMTSLTPTEKQKQQLQNLIGYEHIYVFDNDKNNKQVNKKIMKCIKEGKRIFLWPKQLNKFKDVNEVCTNLNLFEMSWNFIVKHSFKGQEAEIKFKLNSP